MEVKNIAEIASLSIPEKILLLEDLWDSISSESASIPVPSSHKKELSKRLKCYKSAPGKLLSLEELQSRIEVRK